MKKIIILLTFVFFAGYQTVAQDDRSTQIKVYPKEISDVLNNPGIGFTTFQRFNGDELNAGSRWTEGLPIEYQEFNGDLTNKNHPQTTIAYFRVNWRFLEPEREQYNWPMIDKALRTAAERGQTLMLRVSPYELTNDKDVPDWYRKMVGPATPKLDIGGFSRRGLQLWRIDPEDPRYLECFGGFIKALGQRYDGHPDLESVDISFIGPYGEGAGSHVLSDRTRIGLINSYLDNFKHTQLHYQPLNGDAPDPGVLVRGTNIAAYWPDGRNNGEGPQMRHVGYRLDCLGDVNVGLTGDAPRNHMRDIYPNDIILSGMGEAWKKAHVSMEICGTFLSWLEGRQFDEETVEWVFNEGLKWHLSTFNAKSSPVPEAWSPLVNKWLNKMGYRFVVRKFEYPSVVQRQAPLPIQTRWENIGVAPIYREYIFAVRLRNSMKTIILPTDAKLTEWLPGDILHYENLYIPFDAPLGKYQLEVAIVSPASFEPRVKLAIEGKTDDGWYHIGEIEIKENSMKDK